MMRAAPIAIPATPTTRTTAGAGATDATDALKKGITPAIAVVAPPARSRWSGSHQPWRSEAGANSDRAASRT